jgi:peptidoglycan hydrolase-like protein with peptidoglycan-binding domain
MQSIERVQASGDLRLGSKGDEVKDLQELLNFHGYSLKVDGMFGAGTETAVKDFQKKHNLKVDGIVGSATRGALIPQNPRSLPTLRRGSTGYFVKFLQQRLSIFGYTVTIDRVFGARTEAVVKQFQKDQGLLVDGIVGLATWQALHAIDFT